MENTFIHVQLVGFFPHLFLWLANIGIPNIKICYISIQLNLTVGIVSRLFTRFNINSHGSQKCKTV